MSYAPYGQQQRYAPPPAQGYGQVPPSYQQGGYPPQHRAPPPGADPQLWSWFASVDRDQSGAIGAEELKQALVNGDWTPFDLDTIKLLMSIFDVDRSGTIGFNEFAGLWKYIKDWQNVFRHFDRDQSGSIDANEMQDAMRQFGFNISPQLLNLVIKKYGASTSALVHPSTTPGSVYLSHPNTSHLLADPKGSPPSGYGAPSPGVTFDRFVRACVVIKQLTESFRRLDTQGTGWIQLNYDTFMQTVLQLP